MALEHMAYVGTDFLGLRVLSYSISGHRDLADVTRFGDLVPQHVVVSEHHAAEVQIWIPDTLVRDRGIDVLLQVWYQGAALRSLGVGHHCPYCNTVWTPGILICPNCEANTVYQPGILAYERDAFITNIDLIQDRRGMHKARLELELAQAPNKMPDWNALLLGRPEAWLCAYCGLYVTGGQANCPGCGGNRLPVKELSKLKRTCIYCGQTTWGNYACPTCGGRLRRT